MKLFTVSYVGNISKYAKFESPETHYKFSSVISRRINRQKTEIPPTASLQPPPTGAIVVPIGIRSLPTVDLVLHREYYNIVNCLKTKCRERCVGKCTGLKSHVVSMKAAAATCRHSSAWCCWHCCMKQFTRLISSHLLHHVLFLVAV